MAKQICFILLTCVFGLLNSCSAPGSDHKNMTADPCRKQALLILAQQPDTTSTLPAIIAKNIGHIESMPFDGMFINSRSGWEVMAGKTMTWDEISSEFAPLKGAFKKFKNNFLMIYIDFPGDFWDEDAWNTTAENFALMARMAKELGCSGIVYDNEEYKESRWLDYEGSYKNTAYDLNEHRDQSMARGRQVMEAMVREFPGIEVLNYHGPYLSEPNYRIPSIVFGQAATWDHYELLGPFFVGMMQGKSPQAAVIDGGEVYQYRSAEDFNTSYMIRKYEIASEETDSWFIPLKMRMDWPNQIQVAFGVYNKQWKPDYPMNPEIMESTLINAMHNTDKYVWYYTEEDNWLLPGKMPEVWQQAVRNARDSLENTEAIILAAQKNPESGKTADVKNDNGPFLILAQRPTPEGYPAVIAKQLDRIENLPFDGMFINSVAGWRLMRGEKYPYEKMWEEFAVLENAFRKFEHNYLYIFIDFPGDLWDDAAWDITVENFANMARIAKKLACKGIVYDNEPYMEGRWENYGEDYQNPDYDLAAHGEQVRYRGKQVMEAMAAIYPEIEIFNYHGPYCSEPKTPARVRLHQVGTWDNYELRGPFIVGMMQGKGAHATVIDGGEVYQYRTVEDFEISYQWRKNDIASEETDSWMIPQDMRSGWGDNINISFGVMCSAWVPGFPMNPEIMRTSLGNALKRTDKYVWYYTDRYSWLVPGKIDPAWEKMVREVRSESKNK